MNRIASSEITPEHLYLSRRRFIAGLGTLAMAPLALASCTLGPDSSDGAGPDRQADSSLGPSGGESAAAGGEAAPSGGASATAGGENTPAADEIAATDVPASAGAETDELGDLLTSYDDVTTYNNYYEFSTGKAEPARLARDFVTSPWTVEVGGLVSEPGTYDIDDLRRRFGREERIYRLRCVEAWSMVIPWLGFPLAKLLAEVEPTARAKYVRFETRVDPDHMPGLKSVRLDWPYTEGLRLDEAMNDLTLLATGLYGKDLLPQNGAPVRLVVPWKYGFKSIKSIVRIDLVEDQPTSTWMAATPSEYGFYANVNPDVDHPRWSQASERRIGEFRRSRTLPFNGYAEQVAQLYDGMNLRTEF